MKKALAFYAKHKLPVSIGVGLLLVIIASLLIFKGSNSSLETAYAELSTVTEKIGVTGKVAATKKAELGFEKGGVVTKINYKVGDQVKVGDIIISLDSADAYAQYQGAQANLLAEQARLTEMQKGLRPEELLVEDSKLKSAQVNYEDARTGIITALSDSYIKTENTILNYIGIFFEHSQSVNPRINVMTESTTQENKINNSRVVTTEKLRAWKQDLDSLTLSTSTDPIVYLNKVHGYLEGIKNFMSLLSDIISNLNTGSSGLSKTTIDSYNVTMNAALSIFNTAVSSIATAEANYRSTASAYSLAKDQFNLRKAGSSSEALQSQQSKVQQASSNVTSAWSELAKKRLVSPIGGIVSKIVPELGEFVPVGQVSAVVISDLFKVEVNVPESDIAKVSVGNTASITLDAYDQSTVFTAHVIAIDPAETIVEGVPTYKVTLQFDEKDERVRSGMTANIDIITHSKENVVTVPFRAVLEKNGEKYVRVIQGNSGEYSEVKVTTGIRGNDGKIEIVSGLESGAKVVTFVK